MVVLEVVQDTDLKTFSGEINRRITNLIDQLLSSRPARCDRLHEAMRYVLDNRGKRVRPLLIYATGIALKQPLEKLDTAALAVELIHTYSLVHDDLPAMDDDQMRRGVPTCHIAFDEATAILVGDALQSLAFEVIADGSLLGRSDTLSPEAETQLALLSILAKVSGAAGMVAGQSLDLIAESKGVDLSGLERIHRNKTGRLIEGAVQMAVTISNETDVAKQQALSEYAESVGLAFQIQDDILDVIGSTEEIGKQVGVDQQLNKATFPSILGLDQAKQRLDELYSYSIDRLSSFGDEADLLRAISQYTISRVN